MRTIRSGAISGAIVLFIIFGVLRSPALGFVVFSDSNHVPYTWNLDNGCIHWQVGDGAPSLVRDSAVACFAEWSAATDGKLSFCEGAGGISIVWDANGTQAVDPFYIAYTTFSSGMDHRINSAQVVINAKNYAFHRGAPYGVGPVTGGPREIDLDGALLHELGHALGLDHSDRNPSALVGPLDPQNPPTMNSTLHAGAELLHLDDRAGAQSLYETMAKVTSQPQLSIQASPPSGKRPLNVAFFQNTTDEQTYWDFGDGFNTIGANPAHRFTAIGTFTVTALSSGVRTSVTVEVTRHAKPKPKKPRAKTKPKPANS